MKQIYNKINTPGLSLSLSAFLSFAFLLDPGQEGEFVRWLQEFPEIGLYRGGSESPVPERMREATALFALPETGARISVEYSGEADETEPHSYEEMGCDHDLSQKPFENRVFLSTTEDPDCTAESCTFRWSCASETIGFDTVLSASSY